MAKPSIITPVDMGAKPPFNKKLLIIVALIALVLVGLAGMLGSAATAERVEEKVAVEVPFVEGTSRSVRQEWEALETKPAPPKGQQIAIDTNAKDSSNKNAGRREQQQNSIPDDRGIGNAAPASLGAPQDDIAAQGAVSSISVFDESSSLSLKQRTNDEVTDAISRLEALQPRRLTEEEALAKSANMAAALKGNQPNINGGFPDQNQPSVMASKTSRFMSEVRTNQVQVSRVNSAPGKWVVTAGKTIPAVTRRAQNSDLPCAIEATTSVDVYDSYTSTKLLIPKGSELIGVCSNDIAYGQDRILSVFQRLILPNGNWLDLGAGVGMDRSGATGLKGTVDNHFLQMFASAFAIAFIADRVDKKNSNTGTSVYYGNADSAKSAAGQVMVDTSEFMLNRNKQIQPTIEVEAGRRIYIQVKHDMVFD
jgi:type IV secretion system protein VirB10